VPLLEQVLKRVRPRTVLADAGYDSEPNHSHARGVRGVRSVIPAAIGRPSVKPPVGRWRRRMKARLNKDYCQYGQRWQAEVYHDIEKNGCKEEERRFETAERMEVCLAVLSIGAVRVFQLRSALTAQPDEPAERVATGLEIRLIGGVLKHRGKALSVRKFVRGVAKLGGFLGRKGDGEPGVRAL
jgi:hypothetical protein